MKGHHQEITLFLDQQGVTLPPLKPFLAHACSPTELKADQFLGNVILKYAPDWLFREAERWEDPWKFLLGVPGAPPAYYDLFRAAESAARARKRLIEMAWGAATLNRSLTDEIEERKHRGDESGALRVGEKLFLAQYRHGCWRGNYGPPMTAKEQKWIDEVRSRVERKIVKRSGREGLKPKPLPTAEEIQGKYSDVFLMVSGWVRWGEAGEPGLCYYSDAALAQMMDLHLTGKVRELYLRDNRVMIWRKFRQRHELLQACWRKPIVISARRVQETGLIEIEYNDGSKVRRHQLVTGMQFANRRLPPVPSSNGFPPP